MKILIVSFDRNLTKQLRELLKDHEVIDVRNGEEALNLTTQYFDVIIYDAISGAISEEDINNMYEQKFKDAKFIVLIDDLFPINEGNLKPHKKVFIMREAAVKEILSAIEKPLEEAMELPQSLLPELEIERHTFIEEGLQEIAEVSYPEEIHEEENINAFLEKPIDQEKGIVQKNKVAIVSFDSTLIDNISSLLPKDVEVSPVKSFRNLEDILKDKDLVVFDAISGLTAKRRLMELSKDPTVSAKPFIILIDDLFRIDVEDIPLAKKYAIPRGGSPGRISEKIVEILSSEKIKPVVSEGTDYMQILEEIMQGKEEQEPLEKILESITEIESKKEEHFPFIPTEETILSKGIKETQLEEIPSAQEKEYLIPSVPSQVVIPEEKIEKAIYQAIKDLGPIDEIVRNVLKETMEERLEKTLKEEIRRAIESIPLETIIKEVTYQALKERLSELIT
ncbi:hypothetical protein [Thermocrinis sp.]